MPAILLHQWEMSPFCNKVRRCLRHKGLAFEVKDYNGLEARKASKLSAVGTLPVIDYDGKRIVDSSAIAVFLDEKHPKPALYPEEPDLLARVRFWDDWAAQSLYFYEIYFRMLDPVAMEKAVDLICTGRPGYERAVIRAVFKGRYPKKLAAQGLGKLSKEEVERRFVVHLDDLEAILRRTVVARRGSADPRRHLGRRAARRARADEPLCFQDPALHAARGLDGAHAGGGARLTILFRSPLGAPVSGSFSGKSGCKCRGCSRIR